MWSATQRERGETMKKTLSLILAIVLSTTVFITNIAGITMIVRAESMTETDGAPGEGFDYQPIDADYEAALQQMYEQAAQEANDASQQTDEADEEARRRAEEEAARAEEEAQKSEEASDEEEQNDKYVLVATLGATTCSSLNFGSEQVGTQRDYMPVLINNAGNTTVDLIYSKTNDADGAFSLSLHGDNTHLEPGQASMYNISMRSDLSVGTYTATVLFADKNTDPNFTKALKLTMTGTVTPKKAAVTKVSVSPSRVTLAVGGEAQFYAAVAGTGEVSQDVRWMVAGNRSTGTQVSSSGVLTIANDETSSSINVIATSTQDAAISGSAVVTPQRNSFNVSAYAEPSNGGVITGGGAVSQGGTVTLSAVPSKNFYFAGWVQNGSVVSTDTNYTISNIQSNISLTAKFAQRSVTVTAVANNTNAGNVVGGGTFSYGGSTTISAKAYNGYVFTGWKEGNTVVSRDASIRLDNLTVDRKFTAIFEQTSHTLTLAAYPAEGGKVSGGGTFKLGQGTTIKAEPNSGYKFDGWTINGQVVSRDASVKIDKLDTDFTCIAVFVKEGITSYEISSGVATTGGSISPSGKTLVAKGQKITYTITPKSGYAILAVAVDGNQVGAVSSYTFDNVQGPHTIAAAFVQTDAGKKADTASGKPAQTAKVEPIAKTESNTATVESTVKIEEAATGEAGDDFVEEMDLSEIPIPTDEELGITETAEPEVYSEVTQMLGMSLDEVNSMIVNGNTMPILDAAFYTGSLGAYVQNVYEPKSMTSVDYQNMSMEELMLAADDTINPSLPDLDVVVQKMLSTDDVMKLAKGGHVDIAVSLTGQDKPDSVSERIMKNAVGQKPVQYFDLTMLKTADGYTERVTELPTTMEVVIEIPDEVYSSGKTYSVLRVHNGELTVLPDLDDDPKTITFRTDRFSSYAIAREVATARGLVTWLCAGAAIAFGIATTCFLILIAHQNKMRKLKRHAK